MATKRSHVYISVVVFLSFFYFFSFICLPKSIVVPFLSSFPSDNHSFPTDNFIERDRKHGHGKSEEKIQSLLQARISQRNYRICSVDSYYSSSEVEWNHKQEEPAGEYRESISAAALFHGIFSHSLPSSLPRRSCSLFPFLSSLTLLFSSFARSLSWLLLFEFQRRRDDIERERPRGSNGFLANSGSERWSVKPIGGLDPTGSRRINKFFKPPLSRQRCTRLLISIGERRFRRPLRTGWEGK